MDSKTKFMQSAIEEAKTSLREGNHGFGAVIIKNNEIIAKAHDREKTDHDPTSHAEINAIRLASGIVGKDLKGCTLFSTHEPCPMCATAIVWAGIGHIVYGYSIEDSIKQGRNRIDLYCDELFNRAGAQVKTDKNFLYEECAMLYRKDVRSEIKKLRNITPELLEHYNKDSLKRRLEWFKEKQKTFTFLNNGILDSAYQLLLCRFNIDASQAPIVNRQENRVIFHSKNFCPTLEACKILDLDTRYICKNYNENSTDMLIKQIDSRLQFSRNYDNLRPYTSYCEEMITLESNKN